ncbi:MAG: ABC transporter substrate-binding protein [Deltaproteobacteria bacterium]|jgi:peptide/nickel transport system substrate-binding protein|nr:ABC transporter substrate-binding protein [Deltaproteobacteria bacterium]
MTVLRRFFLSFAFPLAVALALTLAAGQRASATQEHTKGVLVLGVESVLRHFNGAVQSGSATALPGSQIFASPLRYDEHWNPQPYLAESWSVSEDGLSVTLNLVKTAVFHDGQPVTSADVAFSIGAIKKHHPFQTMLGAVDRVDTPDPHTAVIRLSRPHPALLLAMCPGLMPILPKHVYDTGGNLVEHPANLKPVGSGPFKLVEHVPGEHYVLEKFDQFFIPGRPLLDKIVVRVLPDGNSLILSLENGEIDGIPLLDDVRAVQRLEKNPDVQVTAKGFEGIGPLNWLAFNTKKPPLDDVRVRRAIAFAVDRKFVLEKLMLGRVAPAYAPISPGSPLSTTDVEHFDVDLKAAEELLDLAGHKKGPDGVRFGLTIDYEPDVEFLQRNVAEYLRSQLKKIGVAVTVRAEADFPAWANRISNHDFDLTMDTVYNWGDPVIGVGRTYLSSNIRPGVMWSNTQQYVNPKVDELLDAAAVELDPAKRKALYLEFQKLVVSEVPIFFLNVVPYFGAYRKGLEDIPETIWGPLSPLDQIHWQGEN